MESLVGVAVFMIIAVASYQAFISSIRAVHASRVKITATALANEQFEILRNLPYDKVGVDGGIPDGVVPHTQQLVRDGSTFDVLTTIRNIDDPFDGTIGGSPNDLSPADFKLAEVEITCGTCRNFAPMTFTTHIAPKNLESTSDNGSLFVQVFDAAGQPVPDADVHIENNQVSPAIVIDDTTNNDGILQVVDTPPGALAYEIEVTKSGYSTDRTYTTDAGNPNPTKPHATVAAQQLTQISFSIDRTSTLDVASITDTCAAVPSIDFSLAGTKLIGTNPDTKKYSVAHTTGGGGTKSIPNLEWDAYTLSFTDTVYDLAGTIPITALTINPGSTIDTKLVVAPKDPRSVLVTVRDASTQLPLSDASVRFESVGYDESLETGRGFLRQTDWSGGGGQDLFTNPSMYFTSDGDVEVSTPQGEVALKDILGNFTPDGTLTSSTFDTGSPSNFHQILWLPQDQPADTGANSVRLQVATNNDNATWAFKGPDGTGGSYYTLADQNIHSSHDDDRYIRYKLYIQTASTTWTPRVSDVFFTFTSSCVPPGQAFFTGLSSGTYDVTVSKTGYQSFSDSLDVSPAWQALDVTLAP